MNGMEIGLMRLGQKKSKSIWKRMSGIFGRGRQAYGRKRKKDSSSDDSDTSSDSDADEEERRK